MLSQSFPLLGAGRAAKGGEGSRGKSSQHLFQQALPNKLFPILLAQQPSLHNLAQPRRCRCYHRQRTTNKPKPLSCQPMATAALVEAHFFTATILEWKHLLKPDKYKDIIIKSLRFLVAEERVHIIGFVIMSNHIHILWQLRGNHKLEKVQQSFLKYTAQQIKFDLITSHPQVLEHFRSNATDRAYQFWERNALSVPIWTEAVLLQKLNYIHQNLVRAGLCTEPSDYFYSSAAFYETGKDVFGFLSIYR